MNTKMEIYMHTLCTNNDFSVMQQRRILTMNCSLSLSISHVKVRTTCSQFEFWERAAAQVVNGGVSYVESREKTGVHQRSFIW